MTKNTYEWCSLRNLLVLFSQDLKKLGIISPNDDDSNDVQPIAQPGFTKIEQVFLNNKVRGAVAKA